MTKVVYQEVSIRGSRMEPHPETGRKRRKSKKFFQTHNPFNKNAAGEIKTKAEILREITAECRAWEKELDEDLCDHDWEDMGNGEKQCTYPECQKVRKAEQ